VEIVPKNKGERLGELVAGTLILSCWTIIRISVDEIDGERPGSRGCYHTDPDGKTIGKSLYIPLQWDQSDPSPGIYYLLPLSRSFTGHGLQPMRDEKGEYSRMRPFYPRTLEFMFVYTEKEAEATEKFFTSEESRVVESAFYERVENREDPEEKFTVLII